MWGIIAPGTDIRKHAVRRIKKIYITSITLPSNWAVQHREKHYPHGREWSENQTSLQTLSTIPPQHQVKSHGSILHPEGSQSSQLTLVLRAPEDRVSSCGPHFCSTGHSNSSKQHWCHKLPMGFMNPSSNSTLTPATIHVPSDTSLQVDYSKHRIQPQYWPIPLALGDSCGSGIEAVSCKLIPPVHPTACWLH